MARTPKTQELAHPEINQQNSTSHTPQSPNVNLSKPALPASPTPSSGSVSGKKPAPLPTDPETSSDDEDDGSSDGSEEKLPKTDSNPLNPAGNSMDTLIQQGLNDDLWKQMQGNLPCTDATTQCIAKLQDVAVHKNPLLKDIDTHIQEINDKIAEAKRENKKSVDLAIFRPAVRVFLDPPATTTTTNSSSHRTGGAIGKILSIFSSPIGIANELLQAVGIPLFEKFFGGNDQNQQRAIAISDLAVKVAELQRGRAELADKVKEKVAMAVFDFDESRREFQVAVEISKREASRMQLTAAEYRLGQSSSETYLQQLSSLDKNKASTWRSWSTMRSRLAKVKLLVIGTPNETAE